MKALVNQHCASQGPARPTHRNRGDSERPRVVCVTVIPTTRTIQRRGDTQDTLVLAADGRTFLVRQHTNTVGLSCPLGTCEVRRLNAATPSRM